jgi:O-antigen ligase
MRQKIANSLLFVTIFLLPFQSQWIISESVINGGVSEYGKISIYATQVLFVLVLLLRGRTRFVMGVERIVKRLYFLLAVLFFSLTLSFVFNITLFQTGHVLIAGIVFIILLDERTQIQDLIKAFLLGLILPCVLGLYQYFSGGNVASTLFGIAERQALTPGVSVVEKMGSRSLRSYGTFSHPNIFGGYLATGILFLAWTLRVAKEKWELVAVSAWTILFSVALILTFSRSAWLALSVALLVLVLQMVVFKKIPPRKAYPIIALGVLTIVLSVGVFSSNVFARFQTSLRVEAISIEERISQYDSVGSIVKTRPLLGVGAGNYVFALSQIIKDKPVWDYQPIHNSILLFVAEVGFIGLFALLYLLNAFYKLYKKAWKKPANMFFVSFGVMFLALAAFDHYLWSSWSGLVLLSISTAFVVRNMISNK